MNFIAHPSIETTTHAEQNHIQHRKDGLLR